MTAARKRARDLEVAIIGAGPGGLCMGDRASTQAASTTS